MLAMHVELEQKDQIMLSSAFQLQGEPFISVNRLLLLPALGMVTLTTLSIPFQWTRFLSDTPVQPCY